MEMSLISVRLSRLSWLVSAFLSFECVLWTLRVEYERVLCGLLFGSSESYQSVDFRATDKENFDWSRMASLWVITLLLTIDWLIDWFNAFLFTWLSIRSIHWLIDLADWSQVNKWWLNHTNATYGLFYPVCFFLVADTETGSFSTGLTYECRLLLFRALHTLIERSVTVVHQFSHTFSAFFKNYFVTFLLVRQMSPDAQICPTR